MHELWITRLFNDYLPGPANALLSALHIPSEYPQYPWTDWMVCEIVVVLFMIVFFAWARRQFSVENPGRVQHTLEVVYEFIRASAEETVGHDGPKYISFFGTIFLFIFFMNMIGLIPGFDSPTMYTMVPLGMAVSVFFFYHSVGIKAHGPAYIKQFMGPVAWMAPLVVVIELISHMFRPLSLTVRLYANMFAGEQVFLTFTRLTKLIIPVIFVGLHFFVGILQAYIFMLLAMVYIGGAVSEEH